MRHTTPLLFGLLMLVTPGTFAQSDPQGANRDVFAPFVSRIRAAVRDPQVRLTWQDAEDIEVGEYRVYRHRERITRRTFGRATLLGAVEPGVETYVDTPEQPGTYYYAVLAAEADGPLYPIFVPFRNATVAGVTVTDVGAEASRYAQVLDIQVDVQDSAVVVRFDPTRTDRTLAVYRSRRPFTELDSVTEATLVAEIDSVNRRFVDFPVPGVSYYYGVFDSRLVEEGGVELGAGDNVLAEPVSISIDTADGIGVSVPPAQSRRAPLPVLLPAIGPATGRRLPASALPRIDEPTQLDTAAEQAVQRLLRIAPEPEPFDPEPRILPGDRSAEGEGVQVTLARILEGEFADGDYAQAAEVLRRLLNVPLSPQRERRIRFYLGQALYFDGRYEPAFMEFVVAAEGSLYAEVRPWIDGILTGRG